MRKQKKTEVGTIVSESRVLEDPHFPVIERCIRNEFRTWSQFVLDRRGKEFVVIVAFTVRGGLVLLREPKYGQMKNLLTLPAGGVLPGESYLEAGKRELKEETVYESLCWNTLNLDNPLVNAPNNIDGGEHYVVLARDARRVSQSEKGSEVILIGKEDIPLLMRGIHPVHKLCIAISIAALAYALE